METFGMTIDGSFRDGLLRVVIPLPTIDEDEWELEFIVDTGFDGGMTLAESAINRLPAVFSGFRARSLADGSIGRCPVYELVLQWDEEPMRVEILALDGNPLLGTEFFQGHSIYGELTEGGAFQAEPL
jgi:clan AA aspartic protease